MPLAGCRGSAPAQGQGAAPLPSLHAESAEGGGGRVIVEGFVLLAVVVAAAGADEPVAVGDGGNGVGVLFGMCGIISLYAFEPERLQPLDEQTESLLLQILLGVRKDGQPSERGDELHRLEGGGAAGAPWPPPPCCPA